MKTESMEIASVRLLIAYSDYLSEKVSAVDHLVAALEAFGRREETNCWFQLFLLQEAKDARAEAWSKLEGGYRFLEVLYD